MNNTLTTFEDRKSEIDLYFTFIKKIDEENCKSPSLTNSERNQLVKIMKSNLLLMLYNLVEACIIGGMLEIYENLKKEKCKYSSVKSEIQKIWTKQQLREILNNKTLNATTYENSINRIINNITSNNPIVLTAKAIGNKGNIDSKTIKAICDSHCIRYNLSNKKGDSLDFVKNKRNSLGHGDVSFSECGRQKSVNELEVIKDEVFQFIKAVLDGMTTYYNEKQYLK